MHFIPLALLLLLLSLPAGGRKLDVGRSKSYATIGSALAAARDGDDILIHAGPIYRENLVVRRSVRRRGVGLPVVDGGGKGNVVEVRADGVTLSGCSCATRGGRRASTTAAYTVSESRG